MKKFYTKLSFLFILLLPILFLTACVDADWELLEIAFESWAEENNLYENGEWQPDGIIKTTIEKTIGDINHEKEFVELDGLEVVKDIEEADRLANQAWEERNEDRMLEAINLRPKDWRLREQDGVFTLSRDDDDGYSLHTSDQIIHKQVKDGADCINLRTQQLEYRDSLLQEQIEIDAPGYSIEVMEMQKIQLEAQEELQGIYATGQTQFCDQ